MNTNNLAEYRKTADRALGDYRHARRSARDEAENLEQLKAHAAAALEAQKILQGVAQAVQTKAHDQIAKVVTRCIRTCGWNYDFKIEFERKRGRTEARMVFLKNGHEVDPISGAGAGVVDVAAFALRIAGILLAVPRRRRLEIADEPFKNVNGKHHQQAVINLVETLAKELKFQFVFASDNWFRPGKVIEIGGTDDETLGDGGPRTASSRNGRTRRAAAAEHPAAGRAGGPVRHP